MQVYILANEINHKTRHMHTLNLKSVAHNPEPDSNFLIKKSSINSLALCDYNKWPWFPGLPMGCSYNTPTTATRSHCPKLTEATKSNQKLAKVTHKGSNKCKCQWRWPVMLVIALMIFFSLQLSVPLELWWNKKMRFIGLRLYRALEIWIALIKSDWHCHLALCIRLL